MIHYNKERGFVKMDANAVVTLIGSVGFPIVACIGMAWYVKYQMDANNKEVKEIRSEYNEQIKTVTEALNNNTLAIQRLVDKIEKG